MRLFYILLIFVPGYIMGQEQVVEINAPSETLLVGDEYFISVIIRDSPKSEVSQFPQIEGLRRESRSVSHSNVTIEGKRHLQHTVRQKYVAIKPGKFSLSNSEILVNSASLEIPALVLEITDNESEDENTIMSDSLSSENSSLVFLFVNKKDIHVGESFKVHFAFYVSENNTEGWEFPNNLTTQVNRISQLLSPKNSVVSKREIKDIKPENAKINNQNFIRYKLYEAIVYPLSDQEILLPSVQLIMDKRVGEGDSSSIEKTAFYSKPFSVNVEALPEHPSKLKLAVGNFTIESSPLPSSSRTGRILNYNLAIKGTGNMKSLTFDKPINDEHFDFYPPSTTVKQTEGLEAGIKNFTFKIFPKDSGTYKMQDYFEWIYFNTLKNDFDTLKPSGALTVQGPTIITSSETEGSIYEKIEEKEVWESTVNWRNIVKNIANVLLFLMLVGMLFIFEFRKN
ncbi:hypothetical protein [Jiulongibacter sp. NS-SX5]|uniref:hypothetical protein n=1 Tax=Jiulongibacter sp. NS-SX5 TaxID=3463854 RepID=UPI0040583AB5